MKRDLRLATVLGALTISVFGATTIQQGRNEPVPPRFERKRGDPLTDARASTGGVSWIDFDGDGLYDVFVGNGYDVSARPIVPQRDLLYRNRGGRFELVPGELAGDSTFSSGSAWADFDNDGLPDVFIPTQRNQRNVMFRNRGDGRFERILDSRAVTESVSSFAATWADVDRNGFVDLFVSNGGLTGAARNSLYRNRNGRLEPVTGGSVTEDSAQWGGATWVDYDLDGDVDLFVPGARAQLFRNDGDWKFTRIANAPFTVDRPLLTKSLGGAWGDCDNDGDFDLYLAYEIGEQNRMYLNDRGTFRRIDAGLATREGGYSVHAVWADVNNDTWLDLLVANWSSPTALYMNSGGCTLHRVVDGPLVSEVSFASSLTAADYDGDGALDVLIGHWPNHPGPGEENPLYRNVGPVGNWLQIDLEGTASNRSAIGARVVAFLPRDGEPVMLTREVRSQDGWRSQSPLTMHFGLGVARQVDSVVVHWPSGTVQTLRALEVNRRIRVREAIE